MTADVRRALVHCFRTPQRNVARHARAKTIVKTVLIRPAPVAVKRVYPWIDPIAKGVPSECSVAGSVFGANPVPRLICNARGTLAERMDRTTSGPSAVRYPAAANGVLTSEGLLRACAHVWRDSNSVVMLGADILNSEPVSCDDKQALTALRRHIAAAGPRAFIEDVLPNLGFGPVRDRA